MLDAMQLMLIDYVWHQCALKITLSYTVSRFMVILF